MTTDQERPSALVCAPPGAWRHGVELDWALSNMREFAPSRRVAAHRDSSGSDSSRDPAERCSLTDLPVGWQRGFRELQARQIAMWRQGRLTSVRTDDPETDATGDSPRLIASVTKSIIGFLVAEHIDDGSLDADAPAAEVSPLLADSGYGTATIAQLLDMQTSVDYLGAETPQEIQDAFHAAVGLAPAPPGAADSIEALLRRTVASGPHGGQLRYDGVTTEALAVVLRDLTGRSLRQNVVDRVWTPMQAASDADWIVDRQGWEHSAGGLATTALELARFGRLVIERVASRPHSLLGRLADRPELQGGYQAHWWLPAGAPGVLQAHGQWGQWLHVDPGRDVVVACLGTDTAPWSTRQAVAATALFSAIAANSAAL